MKLLQISPLTSDILKGMACLLIVTHHFFARLMGIGYDNLLINFIGVRGGVAGVTIFFFLSAWGLSESQSRNRYPFGVFIKRRLSKVYVPLMLTNFIYLVLLLLFGIFHLNPTGLLLGILNFKIYDGVLWFCNVILIFYLIFYLSFIIKPKWAKVAFCIISTLCYSVISTLLFPDAPYYVYSIIGFPFGMVCSLYKEHLLKLSYFGIWLILGLGVLILGAMLFPDFKKLFLMNSFCLIMLTVLVVFIQRLSFSRKLYILPFIGLYSYEIYLLHNKVLVQLGNAGSSIWYPLAFLLIVIPLAILLKRLDYILMNSCSLCSISSNNKS